MKNSPPQLYNPLPLKAARQSRYRTQAEFANKIGVARFTISRLENAEDVSLALLKRACDELGLSVEIVPSKGERK